MPDSRLPAQTARRWSSESVSVSPYPNPNPRRIKFRRQEDVCHATWQTMALTKVAKLEMLAMAELDMREKRITVANGNTGI